MHAKIRLPSPIHLSTTSILDRSMGIGLICTSAPDRFGVRWNTILLLGSIDAMLLTSERTVVGMIGFSNRVVCSGGDELLPIITTTSAVGTLVVVRSTTADCEHPEETTSDAECGC